MVASPSAAYNLRWSRFDNATGTVSGTTEAVRIGDSRAAAPLSVLTDSEFASVEIRTEHSEYPQWADPVHVDFRRMKDAWRLVGTRRGGH